MASLLKAVAGQIRCWTGRDTAVCDGVLIPAKHLRFGGENFASDETFLGSGQSEAKRLRKDFGLRADSRLLEIGCGTGRLPIGIISTLGDIACYRGVDVSETAVAWCRRHIERHHPHFRFLHINVRNERYNPHGARPSSALPFNDNAFDIVYLYSVFSHLLEDDVRQYLREFHRLLGPGGSVFLTAFVEDNVPSCVENPQGYRQEWKGALHCVRFDRAHFESLCTEAGFVVHDMRYGTETNGQSAYHLLRSR